MRKSTLLSNAMPLLHTERLYSTRTRIAVRIALAVTAYLLALFLYPTAFMVVGFIGLIWYGSYEMVGAAFLLDALLAPGGSMLGDYHYTALFLVASAATLWVRDAFFTAQHV